MPNNHPERGGGERGSRLSTKVSYLSNRQSGIEHFITDSKMTEFHEHLDFLEGKYGPLFYFIFFYKGTRLKIHMQKKPV